VIVVPLIVHGPHLRRAVVRHRRVGPPVTRRPIFQFAEDLAYRAALAVENARAYRQVNAANRAKDEFLATLSHELRTPLNAVLVGAHAAGRRGQPCEDGAAFEVIERNAAAQLDLVEDLLDLSRIITGKFRLNVASSIWPAAIDAAVEAVQPAATAKGITIQVESDPDANVVIGDERRLQQAVWNMLSNAIKFTSGSGHVTVTRRRKDANVESKCETRGTASSRRCCRSSSIVSARATAARRGRTWASSRLAIVRHVVELHGGTVGVTSAGKGQGSTFLVSLPVVPASIASTRRRARGADGSQTSADHARRRPRPRRRR